MSITMIVGRKTADHEFGEILDGQMITTGRAVFSIVVLELRQRDASAIPTLLDEFVRHRQGVGDWIGENNDIDVYDNEFFFQLDDATGKTVFASQQPALVPHERASTGLFKIGSNDNQWHVFGLRDAQTGYTFYTGQSQKLRQELSSESVEYILLPFALVTIFILGAIWVGTRYGLKPLLQLTQELHSRSPQMLDIIEIDNMATELRPLIIALNRLFTRVSSNIAKERQFSADASHELRTPLAGITANLDAVRCLSVLPEQERFLNNIESCVNNATRVTKGLLLLARLQGENVNDHLEFSSFDVFLLIQCEVDKRVELNSGWAGRVHIQRVTHDGPFFISGPRDLIGIAIGNILDNALKYSTEAVYIELKKTQRGATVITISDRGPGIPDDNLNLVFNRFYRHSTNKANGFGLGLALVFQIFQVLGGSIQLANRLPNGLKSTLTFPEVGESDCADLIPPV